MGKRTTAIALCILVALAAVPNAFAINCVQYVKASSEFNISGNAWLWWDHAAGIYERGKTPREGSVLVFKRTNKMHSGHVALVSRVLDGRTLLIDHANWGAGRGEKGRVQRGVLAIDCSSRHDWSAVCVWNEKFEVYGRPYPTNGFIYPQD
jgi:surface antigen